MLSLTFCNYFSKNNKHIIYTLPIKNFACFLTIHTIGNKTIYVRKATTIPIHSGILQVCSFAIDPL